ncbi:MAG: PTS transporter subunit EIIA [Lentisphaerae bacterium]|nr:PTS transporter subunit EIIA [Lentisphaerota bacterium]
MQLGVSEAAKLLNVSEKTVYRWLNTKLLPAYRINRQYRFERAELIEWVLAHKVNASPALFELSKKQDVPDFGLADALKAGGIRYRIGGIDKESCLKNVVDQMPLLVGAEKDTLVTLLLAREDMGSTSVGDGIAIPHVRNPIVLHIEVPMITLCFLENAIDFGALDGKPVDTLFTLFSPSVRAHVRILSCLSFALQQEEFLKVIKEQGSREEIIDAAERFDEQLCMIESEREEAK